MNWNEETTLGGHVKTKAVEYNDYEPIGYTIEACMEAGMGWDDPLKVKVIHDICEIDGVPDERDPAFRETEEAAGSEEWVLLYLLNDGGPYRCLLYHRGDNVAGVDL